MNERVALTIDEQQVEAYEGATILEAALQRDIYIPHLCYQPDLEPPGACRLCTVELQGGGLVSACRTPVEPGLVAKTKTPQVEHAVRSIVELLIADHHSSCRGCPSSGHCELQRIMARLRIDRRRVRRLRFPETEKPVDTSSPALDYDQSKCVLCGVCVRACQAAQAVPRLYYLGRGYDTRVAFFGTDSTCDSCLACVTRCPVGALRPKRAQAKTQGKELAASQGGRLK